MVEDKLILTYLGIDLIPDVADWSKYDDKSLTEYWNNDKGTFVKVPKGEGFKWYKVLHRGQYYQLYTDFTFSKLKESDIRYGFDWKGTFTLLEGCSFSTSWDWLMVVVAKIVRNEDYIEDEYREAILDTVPYGNIEDVYKVVIEFLKARG